MGMMRSLQKAAVQSKSLPLNPQGRTVQESYLASRNKQRWDITVCTSYDAKGHGVQTHHAFISSTPAFVTVSKRTRPATVQFQDAAGHQIGQFDPDHIRSKAHMVRWIHWIYDKGADLGIEDPAGDLDVGVYISALGSDVCFPPWLDLHLSGDRHLQATGQKAIDTYASRAVILLYDRRGNRVSKIQGLRKDEGTQPIATDFGYDALGNLHVVDAIDRKPQATNNQDEHGQERGAISE
ncbi:hypothetical protein ACHAO9_012411 [Fusarium lateritium]